MLGTSLVIRNVLVIGVAGLVFVGCAIALLLWVDSQIYVPGQTKISSHVTEASYRSWWRRWITAKRYLFRGRALVSASYVSGQPYIVPTPKQAYVLVSSEKHIKEYTSSKAVDLHSAYDDIFASKYNKLWYDEGEDLHATQVLFFRVLREGLTTRLPALYPSVQETIAHGFADYLKERPTVDGWQTVEHFPMFEHITVNIVGPIFFGQELWADPEFQNAARKFPAQYFAVGEIAQHVPNVTIPLMRTMVTRGNRYRKILVKNILPMVRDYLREVESPSKLEENRPMSIVQYAVNAVRGKSYWTPERIVAVLESLWRAAVPSVPMTLTHAINALCRHPEYIDPLRKEIFAHPPTKFAILEGLPYLNSFLKETMRTSPTDSVSARRKVLQPFTFTDGGLHVPAGQVLCVPSYEVMNDPANYSSPHFFNAFRFVAPSEQDQHGCETTSRQASKVVDVSTSFPFWGYGKEACPGRYFASFEMKAMMVHLLSHYDFELRDASASATWTWRSFLLPRKEARLLIRARR